MNDIAPLVAPLSSTLRTEIEGIANKTINIQKPLRVCVVGEFSTGKSSLINALLEKSLLPSAREETTALPTFIEYAPELKLELVYSNGNSEIINLEKFIAVTINAPDESLCSLVHYPADWLKDLTLVDLPGLGSTSQQHSDYTHAQVSAADTIIYLLSNRGATQTDLALLKRIKQYGKQVMIAVSQWDCIEQSIKEGEQAPNLSQWQADIVKETGLNQKLIGVSKHGHGRETVINFLQQVKQQIQSIRQQRFYAELEPLLNNALGQLNTEISVYSTDNAEDTQKLHEELLQQRQALLKLKTELYQHANQEQNQLEQQAQQFITGQREQLNNKLNELPIIESHEQWQSTIELAHQQLQNQVLATASKLTELSTDYGQLNLSEIEIQQLNLRLPPPETIVFDDFVDASRLSFLETELEKIENAAIQENEKLTHIPKVNVEAVSQKLEQLRVERNQLAQKDLPTVTHTIEGTTHNSDIGRNIGHLLDAALIVFEAPLIVVKAASMLSQSAKAAEMSQRTVNGVQIASPSNLGFLEKLSFSYWCEQIGKNFDRPTEIIETTNPEAAAEKQRLLQEQDEQIATQRAELQRLEDLQQQRDYSSWALEQNLKEQQRLKANIETLQTKAEAAHREAQAEAQRQQQALFNNYQQQLIAQCLVQFDQQTRPMIELLRSTCKNYWQDYVNTMLAERLQTVETLTKQLQQAPEQKQAHLAELQQQINDIQNLLNTVQKAHVS